MREDVVEFIKGHEYITICPECAGGLKSPREPAEIFACQREFQKDFRVVDRSGVDVTSAFVRGAEISMAEVQAKIAEGKEIEGAILKANSPSCGTGIIYDGTFSGNKIPGYGVFAEKLMEAGIKVASEKNYREIYEVEKDR